MAGEEEARDEQSGKTQGKAPGFTVTDRRFWAGQEKGQELTEEYRGPKRPTYVEELESRLAASEKRVQEVVQSYRKLQEEMDGFRARLHRDLELRLEQGKASLLAPFLSVVDDVDRALEVAEATSEMASLREGIELVRKRMDEQLAKSGVVAIETLGQPFDPETQEAVEVVSVEDPAQDGVVLKELAKGYMLHERLVRPAKVAVGKLRREDEGPGPEEGSKS